VSALSLVIRPQTQAEYVLSSAPFDSLAPGVLRPLDQGVFHQDYPRFPLLFPLQ